MKIVFDEETLNCKIEALGDIPEIEIGEKVKKICPGRLSYLKEYAKISVDSRNLYYNETDGVLFSNSYRELVKFPPRKEVDSQTYTIPEGVEKIEEYAFQHCYTVETIVLPSTISKIEKNAFDSSAIKTIDATSVNRTIDLPDVYQIADNQIEFLVKKGFKDGYEATFNIQHLQIIIIEK